MPRCRASTGIDAFALSVFGAKYPVGQRRVLVSATVSALPPRITCRSSTYVSSQVSARKGPATSCCPLVSEANCLSTCCARACRSEIFPWMRAMGTRMSKATAPIARARPRRGRFKAFLPRGDDASVGGRYGFPRTEFWRADGVKEGLYPSRNPKRRAHGNFQRHPRQAPQPRRRRLVASQAAAREPATAAVPAADRPAGG